MTLDNSFRVSSYTSGNSTLAYAVPRELPSLSLTLYLTGKFVLPSVLFSVKLCMYFSSAKSAAINTMSLNPFNFTNSLKLPAIKVLALDGVFGKVSVKTTSPLLSARGRKKNVFTFDCKALITRLFNIASLFINSTYCGLVTKKSLKAVKLFLPA